MNVNLQGSELATHLALHLSDLEFELLLRERIKLLFDRMHTNNPNLSESHNQCDFTMSWGDEAKWSVSIGETYNKHANITGQVLTQCMLDVNTLYMMKNGNKLSTLLPAPAPTYADIDDTEDKKW